MRISDWSSDVCSSDLAIAVTLQITQGQEPLRVDEAPLVQHLEMQMRTSGSTCRTHRTDTLCRRDDLTLANIQSRQVGIARDQAIAMVDLHQFAVGTSVAGEAHPASRRSDSVGAAAQREVHPGMELQILAEGVRSAEHPSEL